MQWCSEAEQVLRGSSHRCLPRWFPSLYLTLINVRNTQADARYAHYNLSTPPPAATVRTAWALILLRHPLLASRIDIRAADASFVYTPPANLSAALASADARLSHLRPGEGEDDLVARFMNGPRVLAGDKLAHLTVREGSMRDADLSGAGVPSFKEGWEVLLCVSACVADAHSLHRLAAELFSLLAQAPDAIKGMLASEIRQPPPPLPLSLEERLGLSPLQRAVGGVLALNAERGLGGQSFPRVKGQARFAVVPTRIYSRQQTDAVRRRCEEHGVGLESAVLALCAVAWARQAKNPREPMCVCRRCTEGS